MNPELRIYTDKDENAIANTDVVELGITVVKQLEEADILCDYHGNSNVMEGVYTCMFLWMVYDGYCTR